MVDWPCQYMKMSHVITPTISPACIAKTDAFTAVGPSDGTPRAADPYLITRLLSHPCMSSGKLELQPHATKSEMLNTSDFVVRPCKQNVAFWVTT